MGTSKQHDRFGSIFPVWATPARRKATLNKRKPSPFLAEIPPPAEEAGRGRFFCVGSKRPISAIAELSSTMRYP